MQTPTEPAPPCPDGHTVVPIAAIEVVADMILYHSGQWLPVKDVNRLDRSVLIDFTAEQGMTACRAVAHETTMYRRMPIPTHWLRQRRGDIETIRLNADQAAMVAQRPGAVGDYTKPSGLVWREPDKDERDGWAHYTITPVFGSEPS